MKDYSWRTEFRHSALKQENYVDYKKKHTRELQRFQAHELSKAAEVIA